MVILDSNYLAGGRKLRAWWLDNIDIRIFQVHNNLVEQGLTEKSLTVRRVAAKEIFRSGGTRLLVERHLVGGEIGPHDHDYIDIDLVVGGCARHHSTAGEQSIGAGSLFIMRPGPWHAYADCKRLDVYNCGFGLDLLQRELTTALHDPVLHHLLWSGPGSLQSQGVLALRLPAAATSVCRNHLDSIIKLHRSAHVHTHTSQVAHLLLFLAEIANCARVDFHASVALPPKIHPAVLEGIRLLDSQYGNPWTLAALGRALHLDPSYLVRLWKQHTGLSPMAYLRRCRVERAAVLLLQGDRAIAEIGAVVGWNDPCLFARRFHAHFGMSPSAYRMKLNS